MNISRGFRRLSLLVGLIGFLVLGFLWMADNSVPSFEEIVRGLLILVIAPAVVVCVLGWAVAGFQKSN
jgi:hypothetical protein